MKAFAHHLPITGPSLLCILLLSLGACGGGSAGTTAPASSSSGSSSSSSSSSSSGGSSSSGSLSYRHGDSIDIIGSYGTNDVTHTFLGGVDGQIETKTTGQSMGAGSNGWIFNNLGGLTSVANDSKRGKVLFTPEDNNNYNAVRRFDPGFAIAEQRYFYKAHWVRNVMLLNGLPYTKSYQWKHERVNWENSVSDGDVEIKVHNWQQPNAAPDGLMSFVNRSASDQSTYYGGTATNSNNDWALLEIIVFTGTQGQQDGKFITRIHKDGKTYINQNRQTERIYADPTLRLRYFVEQNYFGNFGQTEDGVDNSLPKPEVRELYSDDSRVIVGNAANTGWKRIELRDKVSLAEAKIRELQSWTSWNGNISLRLNTGGLASGDHDLFLVVIDGVDANGWDVVIGSMPIRVSVD